MKDERMKLLTF